MPIFHRLLVATSDTVEHHTDKSKSTITMPTSAMTWEYANHQWILIVGVESVTQYILGLH